MRVALKALNGLDSVDVSLEQGTALTKWKPGNTVTLRQMLAAVEKNGFANKGAKVVVAGVVSQTAGKWRLAVSGTSETFDLVAADPALLASVHSGGSVVVSGSVPEPAKGSAAKGSAPQGSAPMTINVEKIEPGS